MKPICFIGARRGSKGIPRKNLRNFGGKPLIAYAVESAVKSKLYNHVVVSTEDKVIAKIAKKHGAEVPFLRPKKLASDNADMMDVIIHGIQKLKSIGYNFNVLVSRDCTVPFIQNSDILASMNLLNKTKCDAVYGVYKQHHNPYFNMMELDSTGFLKMSKKKGSRPRRRQDAPIVYQLNGFFTFNVNQLLKYQKLVMPRILPYEIIPETGLMIDTEFEFRLAEIILKNKLLKIK